MTIDTQQLEIDLNNLLMQQERESSDLAQQLYIRKRLMEAGQALAQRNAADIDMLINYANALRRQTPQFESYDQAPELAQRFAPELNGHDALRDVVSRSYQAVN